MGIFSFLMFENSPVRDGKPDSKGPYKQGRPGIFPALYWAQLGRLVFGAEDPRRGYRAMGGRLHPKTEVTGGVLAGECKELLDAFFQKLR